jgi:replicative DNA helicase
MNDPFKTDRIPPQSIEAEQACLGAALVSKKAVSILLDLDRDDFYHTSHRRIYEVVRELWLHDQPCDLLTVPEELKRRGQLDAVGGVAYINDLADSVPTAAHSAHYAKTVREKADYRYAIEVGNDIIALGYAQELTPDQIQQEFIRRMLERQHGRGRREPRDLREVVLHEIQRIEEGAVIPVLYTGINSLDWLAGGLGRGEVGIICGRPGGGKSVAGLQFAEFSAETWGPTLIISLEMDDDSLARRALAAGGGFTYRELRDAGRWDPVTGEFVRFTQAEIDQLGDRAKRLARLPHPLLVDTESHQLSRLISLCHGYRLKAGIECVVIDYGQLIKNDRGGKSRVEDVGEVARAVKSDLAMPLNIPVWILVQANREVERRDGSARRKDPDPHEPKGLLQKSDLGWSGDWEASAQQIHFVNRDSRIPLPPDGHEAQMPVVWEVAKNRNDGIGRVNLTLDRPSFRFIERGEDGYDHAGHAEDYGHE